MYIPPFNQLRFATRFAIFPVLILAIILSLAFSKIKFRWVSVVLLLAGLIFERAIYPYGRFDIRVPPIFYQWQKDTSDFAVMNLPLGPVMSGLHLYDQTLHGRKLIGGLINIRVYQSRKFINYLFEDNVRPFFSCQTNPGTDAPSIDELKEFLIKYKIKFVIIYKLDVHDRFFCKELVFPEMVRFFFEEQFPVVYEDEFRKILRTD